jgi:hypothetical protein
MEINMTVIIGDDDYDYCDERCNFLDYLDGKCLVFGKKLYFSKTREENEHKRCEECLKSFGNGSK